MSSIGKYIVTENKLLVSNAREKGGWYMAANGNKFPFGGDENIQKLNNRNSFTSLRLY